ncbi:hypothetical protein PG637_06940 [Riemerella anatipestifer]|nr:hypothetical protein [Riemerella anatipestifer]MDY3325404.1 hypothetical protein [Riemerella anatipestifer]MDY3352606.1 hypothetical protein [Riemerella anatipestifer]
MKKTLLCAVFLPLVLNAQDDYRSRVGINTNTPQATLDISKVPVSATMPDTKAQGVLFPKFTTSERSAFSGTAKEGTMIYNLEKHCLEIYRGVVGGVHQWSCLSDAQQAQALVVSPAGFEGSYIGGVAFTSSSPSANRTKFKLENNSFSNINSAFHDAVTIQNGAASIAISNCQWQKLNGATPTGSVMNCTVGYTVSLNSGESAMLWYTMSGTPETGPLKADFTKLGAQADQTTTVGLGSASITTPKIEYVVSLTYNSTNIQGKITNGMTIKIPYTGGLGSYNAAVATPTTTAPGQGGDVNTLSLSIPAGNFLVSGDLVATLTVDGDGVYNVTKMAPGQEYTIATIPYTLNGNNYEVVLKGIGGIPDRCFGKTTLECVGYGANVKEHEFVYMAVQGPDGKTWLNNNLGAEYARVGSPDFNPLQQATSQADWKAYGSHFQWQRKPDGHELVNWTSSTTGRFKNGVRTGLPSGASWAAPNSNQTISNWEQPTANIADAVLWQSNGQNNPCPVGFHVPTSIEFGQLLTAAGYPSSSSNIGSSYIIIYHTYNWILNPLALVAAGEPIGNSPFSAQWTASYWFSDIRSVNSSGTPEIWELQGWGNTTSNGNTDVQTDSRPYLSHNIRCVQD